MTASKYGIIIGCDERQEWLLHSFMINLRLKSDISVTIFDFGMSYFGRLQAQKWGEIIPITSSIRTLKYLSKKSRKDAWLKKPQAFLQAPYDYNLWIDLDCLVKIDPQEIFNLLEDNKQILIRKESKLYKNKVNNALKAKYPCFEMYNSGVVAFKKNAPFIKEWVNLIQTSNDPFRGDQDFLSIFLSQNTDIVSTLPKEMNHLMGIDKKKELRQAKVLHFINHNKAILFYQAKILKLMICGDEKFRKNPIPAPVYKKRKTCVKT